MNERESMTPSEKALAEQEDILQESLDEDKELTDAVKKQLKDTTEISMEEQRAARTAKEDDSAENN